MAEAERVAGEESRKAAADRMAEEADDDNDEEQPGRPENSVLPLKLRRELKSNV